MRPQYVADWLPARRVADDRASVPTGPSMRSGVGFTEVVVRSVVPTGSRPTKTKVRALSIPQVRNGPLSLRAERTKTAMRAGGGVRAFYVNSFGVRGSSSQAMYQQAITQAKQQVVDAVSSAQAGLDKIDSTLIGVDSQVQALRDAAGPTAPQDVLAAIDGAASDRRSFGDSVDGLRALIDSMNAAAAAVPAQASIGNFGLGTPGQVALDSARKQATTMGAQVGALQQTAGRLAAKVEAATQAVNRYVDTVNAQATALVQQQAGAAVQANLTNTLVQQQATAQASQATSSQQSSVAFAQQIVQSTITNAQASANAGNFDGAISMLQSAYVQSQAGVDPGLAQAVAAALSQIKSQQAAQQAVAVPSQPAPYTAPSYDSSGGSSPYVPPSYVPPAPPPPSELPSSMQAPPQPQVPLAALQVGPATPVGGISGWWAGLSPGKKFIVGAGGLAAGLEVVIKVFHLRGAVRRSRA